MWWQCYWEHSDLWWLLRHTLWIRKDKKMRSSFSWGHTDSSVILFWTCSSFSVEVVKWRGLFSPQPAGSFVSPLTSFPSRWANAFLDSFSGIAVYLFWWLGNYLTCLQPKQVFQCPAFFWKRFTQVQESNLEGSTLKIGLDPTFFLYLVFLYLSTSCSSISWYQTTQTCFYLDPSHPVPRVSRIRSHVHTPVIRYLLFWRKKIKQISPAKWEDNKGFLFGFLTQRETWNIAY